MKTKRESIRIFQSPILEWTTHVHPIIPLILWTPVVIYNLWRGITSEHIGVALIPLALFLGLMSWTLVEYLLHRFVFHFETDSGLGKRIIYIMHGLHHDDQSDPTRLVMPPVPAIIYAIVLYHLFKLFLGPGFLELFFASFMIGYLIYDYIHYSIHHFKTRGPISKYLKKHHGLHHGVSDINYGVSNPLWDFVFGTYGKKASKVLSSEH